MGTVTVEVKPKQADNATPYHIEADGLGSPGYVNVFVMDSHGTQVYLPPVEDGALAFDGYASWPGHYDVEVRDISKKRRPVLATGSFVVP